MAKPRPVIVDHDRATVEDLAKRFGVGPARVKRIERWVRDQMFKARRRTRR